MSFNAWSETQTDSRPRRARASTTLEPTWERDVSDAVSEHDLAYPAVKAFGPEMAFRVDLQMYRGPLELLLYLVQKHELDVAELPVSMITDQYLEYLELLQQLDVDAVGDFVEVASLLIELKSRTILPRDDEDDAATTIDDPGDELVQRLLEYKKYKDAASMLDEFGNRWQQHYPRMADDLPPRVVAPQDQPIQQVELWDLVSAMGRVMRESQRMQGSAIVYDDTPLYVYMQRIHQRLLQEQRISFGSLFEAGMHKGNLIGVFLAVLELVRNYGVIVEQEELHSDMWLKPSDNFQATLDVSEVFGEDAADFASPSKPR